MAAYIKLETSDTNKCKKCGQYILPNSLIIGWYRIQHSVNHWTHIECFVNLPCQKRPLFHNLIRYCYDPKNLIGYLDLMSGDQLYATELFKKYWDEIGKLRLSKPIYLMKRYEIWMELKKRHLSLIGDTNQLHQRLKRFYAFNFIQKYHKNYDEKLYFGYSKEMEKLYKLYVPKHLKKYAGKYWKTYP